MQLNLVVEPLGAEMFGGAHRERVRADDPEDYGHIRGVVRGCCGYAPGQDWNSKSENIFMRQVLHAV